MKRRNPKWNPNAAPGEQGKYPFSFPDTDVGKRSMEPWSEIQNPSDFNQDLTNSYGINIALKSLQDS